MPTEEQVSAMGVMREYSKLLVSDALSEMTQEQKAKSARLNQKILDLLNAEPDSVINFAASFMAVETIAGTWKKGFQSTLDTNNNG